MGDSAASWLKEWNTVKADCTKRLGKKGKLPKPQADPGVRLTKAAAEAKALEADVKKLLSGIREYQTMLILMQSEADKYNTVVAKSEFGLSKGNSDEERIINKVRYDIDKCLSGMKLGASTPVDFGFKVRGLMESSENLTDF